MHFHQCLQAIKFERENVVLIQSCGQNDVGNEALGTGALAFLITFCKLAELARGDMKPLTFPVFMRDLKVVRYRAIVLDHLMYSFQLFAHFTESYLRRRQVIKVRNLESFNECLMKRSPLKPARHGGNGLELELELEQESEGRFVDEDPVCISRFHIC